MIKVLTAGPGLVIKGINTSPYIHRSNNSNPLVEEHKNDGTR